MGRDRSVTYRILRFVMRCVEAPLHAYLMWKVRTNRTVTPTEPAMRVYVAIDKAALAINRNAALRRFRRRDRRA